MNVLFIATTINMNCMCAFTVTCFFILIGIEWKYKNHYVWKYFLF